MSPYRPVIFPHSPFTPLPRGLGLSTERGRSAYGTVGAHRSGAQNRTDSIVTARGGFENGLSKAWSISLTCATFCYLAWAQPTSLIYNMCLVGHRAAWLRSASAPICFILPPARANCARRIMCHMHRSFRPLQDVARHGGPDGYRSSSATLGLFFFWWVTICCVVTIAVTAPSLRRWLENML